MSKKKGILDRLFKIYGVGNQFTTDDIRIISQQFKFKNHFDIVKIDKAEGLSDSMVESGVIMEKIRKGVYCFSKGKLESTYHKLEPISDDEIIEGVFTPNILYGNLTSENDVLNCIEYSGIAKHFCGDETISFRPIGRRQIDTFQIETDGIMYSETSKIIKTTEIKNMHGHSFNINQLWGPFRYYSMMDKMKNYDNKSIFIQNRRVGQTYTIQMYEYDFVDPQNISSITLIKKREYRLNIND